MTTLTWASNGDTNGLMYWLGTRQGNSAWVNPAVRWVNVRQSTVYPGTVMGVGATDRDASGSSNIVHSTNGNDNWIAWDLGSGTTINPDHYSLRNRGEFDGNHLRNWVLEATNDTTAITNPAGATWTALKTHTSEPQGSMGAWRDWTLTPGTAYRHLRIRNTGADSSGGNYMVFGEIEFYGTATAGSPPPAPSWALNPSSFGEFATATSRSVNVNIDLDHVRLVTSRSTALQWNFWDASTWQVPGRTSFVYTEVSATGLPGTIPPRTLTPAWVGVSVPRTVGQLWPV